MDFNIMRVAELDYSYASTNEAWVEHGIIVYRGAGSSSCPPVVEFVEQNDKNIVLHRKDYVGQVCTSDIVPVVQMITYADGSSIPDDVTIVIE